MSSDNHSRHARRIGRFLVVFAAALVCLAPLACSRQASADRPTTKKSVDVVQSPMPKELQSLPQGYIALFYVASPSQFTRTWFDHVTSQDAVKPFVDQVANLMSGPHGSGRDFLAGFDGPTVLAIYGDPRKSSKPTVLLQVTGGQRDVLEPWVDEWFGVAQSESSSFSDSMVARGGPAGPWVFGTANGNWILCNDEDIAQRAAQGGASEASSALIQSWRNLSSVNTKAFFMADLRRVTPGDERLMLERVGLERVSTISLGVDEVEPGRYQESLFVSSASPHTGVLSFFDGPRLAKAAASSVPANATSFSFLSLDLLSMWENVREILPPLQLAKVQSMEEALAVRFGEDMFAALSTQYACYSLAMPTGEESVVFEIGLDDPSKFREVIDKLLPHSPMRMSWTTTADGQMVLSDGGATGTDSAAATIVDSKLFIFQHASTMNAWLANGVELGGNAMADQLLQRYGTRATFLQAFDSTGFGSKMAGMGGMGNVLSSVPMPVPPPLRSLPWQAFQGAFGNVVVAVVPSKEGIRFVLESGCGLFPALAFMGAGVSGSMRDERRLMEKLTGIVEALAKAQEDFRRARGRYAISLWELKHAALLDPSLARGVEENFLYRVQGDGTFWHMEVRKGDDGQVFRVDDQFQLVPVAQSPNPNENVEPPVDSR